MAQNGPDLPGSQHIALAGRLVIVATRPGGGPSPEARLFARGEYIVWVFSEDEHGEFDQMIDVEITRSGKLDIELRTANFKRWVLESGTGDPVGKVDVKLSGGEVFRWTRGRLHPAPVNSAM